MRLRFHGALLGLAVAAGLASPAAAQRKPTVAIMPAQYFAADEGSAQQLTQALAKQYEGQGYTVMPADQAQSTFQSMSLSLNRHYPDRTAVRFGRTMKADLVVYPRLLGVGLPYNVPVEGTGLMEPMAVVHVRVLNVNTGWPIFFNQIGHGFRGELPMAGGAFRLPEPVAMSAAQEATSGYFQRVAGSRQELRMPPRRRR